jgi:hypothetical protein
MGTAGFEPATSPRSRTERTRPASIEHSSDVQATNIRGSYAGPNAGSPARSSRRGSATRSPRGRLFSFLLPDGDPAWTAYLDEVVGPDPLATGIGNRGVVEELEEGGDARVIV